MTFERFDVVTVPFPFTDRKATKKRPALVLSSNEEFSAPSGHSVLAMITSLENSPWPLDVEIVEYAASGLPSPSKLRFKIFTVDNRLILSKKGALSTGDRQRVETNLKLLFR